MKKAASKQKQSSSQKGFSPIYIIGGVVVLAVVAFVLYSSRGSQSSYNNPTENSPQTSNADQTQSNNDVNGLLDKVESSNYTFYFPKGYTMLDKKQEVGPVFVYNNSENEKDPGRSISLDVYKVSTRMETPSSEFCKEFLQFSLRTQKNLRIVDAKPIDFVKSHGCDFSYVDDAIPGKLAYHEKQLWYKEGDNLDGYGVMSSYLLTASQIEKDSLDLAVNNFVLK